MNRPDLYAADFLLEFRQVLGGRFISALFNWPAGYHNFLKSSLLSACLNPSRIFIIGGSARGRHDTPVAVSQSVVYARIAATHMPHSVTLITTIAVSFGLALLMGLIANRLKLPVLVGYLAAGVILGSNTPGFVADMELSAQLAEIGVILLMFGVGLHFSLNDLLAVRRIALPGAIVQIVVATAFGAIVATSWGWNLGVGIVFGVALSTASTVVLLRALEQRGLLKSVNGSIAVGWLVVEDLAMVLVLVLLPPLAGWLGRSMRAAPAGVSSTDLLTTFCSPSAK